MEPRSLRFPDHLSFLELPTPVQPLTANGRVWLKRDDLTGFPYGGNKPRKLEFLLAEAQRQGAHTVVTTGATGSNHCLATTVHASRLGFDVVLILFPQPETDVVRHHFSAVQHLGAEVVLGDSFGQLDDLRRAVSARVDRPYFIPAGGSNGLGALGYVRAALELAGQLDRGDMPVPGAVYCAAGTLGTLSGLALGFHLAGLDLPLVGVQVVDASLTNPTTLFQMIADASEHLGALNPGLEIAPPESFPVRIETGYFGAGYGEETSAGAVAREWMRRNGPVPVEPTYTAKTMAAVLDAREPFTPERPLLYWHTFDPGDRLELDAVC